MRVSTVAIATIVKLATAYVAAERNVDESSSVSSSSPHQKRSAINRINSRQQRQVIKGQEDNSQNTYDPYLGLSSLSRQQQQRREGGASRRELQDMSMSMAEIDNGDMCAFCPNGLSDPSFVLPTDDGATCEMASAFANTLLPTDPICATVQLAKVFCCKPEPETPEVGTIVDIAVGNPDFSILVSAVTAAGLVDTLSGDGPFTVFAPTDDAFRSLPAGALDDLLQDVDQLTSILTYHVVSGKVASTDLVNGPVPTLNGADVTVDLTDGVKINDANVISPDIEASNGIIHVIDKVLLPPISSTSSTTTMEAEQPELPPLENGQCSCSPLEYNFILNLDSNCETNDIDGQPGIGLTFCFLGVSSPPSSSDARVYFHEEDIRRNRRRLRNTNTNKNHRILSELQRTIVVEDPNSDELSVEQQQQIRFLAEDIEIISIQFLEFDTSGELIVINQDDSYSNASLAHGSVVTFESIANNLDPDVPITDQLDFLPGGVQVTLRGRVTDDVTGDTRIVSNRITWSYTNACDVSPVLESGESIGWITNGDLTPASQAFCPAAPAPPATTTTTTEAPPTTTTTEAPPVTTEAPPTTTTTDAPPLPPVTDEPPLFSKSQKAAKDKKTDSKTHKTPKNPMAKVYKDKGSGKGCSEEEQAEPVSDVDTKSAKAKVDLDAKAEKSSKGAKSKSSKAKCDTEDSKKTSSKATKLFKEGPKTTTHSAMSV